MNEDFLLKTKTASRLYHEYAKSQPIIDYHCHLSPREIAEDVRFSNITKLWLGGDHYKWRLLRANGIPEKYITGEGTDYEKFLCWAKTLPLAVGNPLYHWSHLELKRYFGYEGILNEETAPAVWELCNEKLKTMSARQFIMASNVEVICTTDDPIDDLCYHEQLAVDETFKVKVLPAWRPDRALNIASHDYLAYLEELTAATGNKITTFKDVKEALIKRLDYFDAHGCKLSDHGLAYVMYQPDSEDQIEGILKKRGRGEELSASEIAIYQTALLLFLGKEYAMRGWVMQLHYGVRRNNNQKQFQDLGADTGFDSIGSVAPISELAEFLNALEVEDALPKTIVYSLNPEDNTAIDTILACFQSGAVKGKMQHGSAWWFNDHKKGMEEHLATLASQGLLGNFIGMLTDSRSFLSYTRHEYFRRILCNYLGELVEGDEYPADEKALKRIVEGIAHDNGAEYFGI
ncbi:glucuronate isomerase [Ohessyouella blattaphilus]|uniref:Uronate isomerase n=1 Tax=Ohessyouella blattaphilus TaxID=2949333 RepID=A0ABT1EDK4_9FIRM|nr:glucuronate isomerase [Ohessyouella blattaphilus]MCP1108780.1 glucuronate isomerase [Ohessyouella blattaphilus]MCR8562174.1 glucuronate isomerase [Ohessyouella blattaphilus]